jgi:tetratricopeptide (TPR) repeat protein
VADLKKAQFLLHQANVPTLTKASALFEAARKSDPTDSEPLAGLSHIASVRALWGGQPTLTAAREAHRLSEEALGLYPDHPEGHVARGSALRLLFADFTAAERSFRHALRLDENCTTAHLFLALLYSTQGRSREAIDCCRRARVIQPTSPWVHVVSAEVFYQCGDYSSVVTQCWEVLMLQPDCAFAHRILGLAYEQMEAFDEANAEMQHAYALEPDDPATMAALCHLQARSGSSAEAEISLRKLEAMAAHAYVSPYWFALTNLALRREMVALQALEQAAASKDVLLQTAAVDPRLSRLWIVPEFGRIVRAAGAR